eukprot:s485_g36.t5
MGQGPVNSACTCCFKRSNEPQFGSFASTGTRRSLVVPEMSSDVFSTRSAGPRQPSTGPCIVCRQAPADTVCIPCGHLLVCFWCSQRYQVAEGVLHPDTRCPICKQNVQHFQQALLQGAATDPHPRGQIVLAAAECLAGNHTPGAPEGGGAAVHVCGLTSVPEQALERMAVMANLGLHVFHPEWQNVRPGAMPQGRQYSTTFRMIAMKLGCCRDEEITLPVQTCTKVVDVRDALARALGLDPESPNPNFPDRSSALFPAMRGQPEPGSSSGHRWRSGLLLYLVLFTARASKHFTPPGFEDIEEAWIIGDLHGDIQCAEQWVRRTGLVDLDTWMWQGRERTVLVFMGDYVDRGPEGLQVLTFVRNLTWSFPRNVLALIGNHDLYFLADSVLPEGAANLMGVPVRDFTFSFIHPEEYLNWVPESAVQAEDTSEILPSMLLALQHVYQMRVEQQVMMVEGPGQRSLFGWPPFVGNDMLRQRTTQRLSQWQQHLAEGLHSSGLAEWLLERPAMAVVAGTLFVHGGLMPVRDASELVPLAPGYLHSDRHHLLQRGGADLELLLQATTYRGFHADDPRGCGEVDAVIRAMQEVANVSRIVVGHTPDAEIVAGLAWSLPPLRDMDIVSGSATSRLQLSTLAGSVLTGAESTRCYQMLERNLGNTCFMNAGLQCLSHLKPLSRYILSGDAADEVNRSSDRGSQGQLLDAFAELQNAMWNPSSASAINPHSLHQTLMKLAPHLFEDYQQQDVQESWGRDQGQRHFFFQLQSVIWGCPEFLAFFLDTLHEDLNRVEHPLLHRILGTRS